MIQSRKYNSVRFQTEDEIGIIPFGARALALADDLNPWSTPRISQQRHVEERLPGIQEPTAAELIDSAIAEVGLSERRPPKVIEGPSSLDEYLVDQLFEEEAELLSQYDGFGDDL